MVTVMTWLLKTLTTCAAYSICTTLSLALNTVIREVLLSDTLELAITESSPRQRKMQSIFEINSRLILMQILSTSRLLKGFLNLTGFGSLGNKNINKS